MDAVEVKEVGGGLFTKIGAAIVLLVVIIGAIFAGTS